MDIVSAANIPKADNVTVPKKTASTLTSVKEKSAAIQINAGKRIIVTNDTTLIQRGKKRVFNFKRQIKGKFYPKLLAKGRLVTTPTLVSCVRKCSAEITCVLVNFCRFRQESHCALYDDYDVAVKDGITSDAKCRLLVEEPMDIVSAENIPKADNVTIPSITASTLTSVTEIPSSIQINASKRIIVTNDRTMIQRVKKTRIFNYKRTLNGKSHPMLLAKAKSATATTLLRCVRECAADVSCVFVNFCKGTSCRLYQDNNVAVKDGIISDTKCLLFVDKSSNITESFSSDFV